MRSKAGFTVGSGVTYRSGAYQAFILGFPLGEITIIMCSSTTLTTELRVSCFLITVETIHSLYVNPEPSYSKALLYHGFE
jgi:hypothetical protein